MCVIEYVSVSYRYFKKKFLGSFLIASAYSEISVELENIS